MNNSGDNIIEWLKVNVRSLRMKEIEYANGRQYEKAIEIREKIKELVQDTRQRFPSIFKDIKDLG